MKKRVLAAALASVLALSSFSGCSSNASSATGSGGSTQVVKLKAIMLKHPLTIDLNKMDWLTKVEKKANVDIEWQQISADWDQKKPAMLASGDIPDMIFGTNTILDSDFSQYQGLFQDLTDLIKKDAPNITKMFTDKPVTKTLATQLDGKIYGLPKYQRYWPSTVSRQYINKQWLDKLQLKAPTNWDELYNVLVAFKTKDPNGNGKADEIPMDWAPLGKGASPFGAFNSDLLLCSTGITLSSESPDGFFVEDGKVKNFLTDERYKTFVKFLNKCYTAGLISSEVFTQDYTKYQAVARGSENTAKVGFTWGWEITDRVGNTLAPQYETVAPLKVSADSTATPSWDYSYDSLNYYTNSVMMSSKCTNKDAAMKFIDSFYDPTVSMQVLFGSLGTCIKDNGDGSYSVLPPADSKVDPGTWKWTNSMADDGPMYIADSLKLTLGTDMQANVKQSEPFEKTLKTLDLKKNYLPITFLKYSNDDNNTITLAKTNLSNLAVAKYGQWITKGGIDADWSTYLANCKKTGIADATALIQKYYDDYEKNNG